MSFFKSLKEKIRRDESNPSDQNHSPEISYDDYTTKRDKQRLFGTSTQGTTSDYTPSEQYTSPSGPPPSQKYHSSSSSEPTYAAPPGPPPSHKALEANPPPYQDWLSVPDTSQLPPPPTLSEHYSPTNNASEDAAEAGRAWCESFRVYEPRIPNQQIFNSVAQQGRIELELPHASSNPFEKSTATKIKLTRLPPQPSNGITSAYRIESPRGTEDTAILSKLPMYFAAKSNPLLSSNQGQGPVILTYSIRILSLPQRDAIIAIGLASKPYPPFRQPGWHRSSLAVHSDDGHRYIHDPYGGIPFLPTPFNENDTITLRMTIHPQLSILQRPHAPDVVVVSDLPKCRCRVDVLRNGRVEGGWDVHEEKDGEADQGVEGLQGEADLYAAVGVYGRVACEVMFGPADAQFR